jgi:hypothetical protein
MPSQEKDERTGTRWLLLDVGGVGPARPAPRSA